MLTVYKEPVEPSPTKGLGDVWVAEADESTDDRLPSEYLLLKGVLHPLTNLMKDGL
jgi:hypothetical protein